MRVRILRRAVLACAVLAAPPVLAQDTVAVVTVTVTDTTGPFVEAPAEPMTPFNVSPLLPQEHWAVRAALRAEALGLAPGFFPAQRSVPRHAVYAALLEAVVATDTSLRYPGLARGWLERFTEEFPEYASWLITPEGEEARGVVYALGRSISAGYAEHTGRLAPAIGYQDSRQVPLPIADEGGGRGVLAAGGGIGRRLALFVEGVVGFDDPADARMGRWEAMAGAGAWSLSAGRGEVGYGYGRGGAVVLSPAEPFPRLELQTTRPIRLPWVLGRLGEASVHTFLSRVDDEERHPTDPWMWGMRVAARPHPRVTIAVNRTSIFGGEGRPSTPLSLARMLVGVIRSDFESQIVSFEGRYRLPTEGTLPVTAYLEWGADDGAGAFHEMPARLAGLFVPALPGVPELAVGVEYARFAKACCGHGTWYFNGTFPGNWARDDRPLGHPLGGEGVEASAYAQAELMDARLRVDGRVFVRDRSGASLARRGGGNQFTPDRTGTSTGGSLKGALRLMRALDVRAGLFVDAGDGWRERAFHAELAAFF